MPVGYLSLVLHAHLPFVRHPEYEDFLEEDWLYEAITETYIPLLEVFDGLERDGVDWRLTMSVTPTLAAMLSDPLLQYRYVRHIDNLIALATKVAALARDTESSKQVWSAVEGYPGDSNYRDFYRDVGFDLDYEYVKPHLHQTGIRSLLGIKYHRITGRTDHKLPYDPKVAMEKAADHAGNFMFNREKQVEWLSGSMDRPSLIVAPYDAELFGHWWYEGPQWIDFLLRKMHWDQQTVKTVTIPEYLDRHTRIQVT